MYTVTFNNGVLEFKNSDTGQVLYRQPFKPGIDTEESRPWRDANEAFDYWTQSARSMYIKISDEMISIIQES